LTRSYLRVPPLAERQEVEPVLRKTVLGRRDAMDPRTRTALSRAIVYDLFDLAAYRRSGTVMAYVGFGSELQTDEFVLHTLDRGKSGSSGDCTKVYRDRRRRNRSKGFVSRTACPVGPTSSTRRPQLRTTRKGSADRYEYRPLWLLAELLSRSTGRGRPSRSSA